MTDYRKPARKIIRYLEDECGWTIRDPALQCSSCSLSVFSEGDNFCSQCGGHLVADRKKREASVNEVATALRKAIGETG